MVRLDGNGHPLNAGARRAPCEAHLEAMLDLIHVLEYSWKATVRSLANIRPLWDLLRRGSKVGETKLKGVKPQDSSDVALTGADLGSILRRPSVSGSIGALVGLLAGVLIGRATVHRPEAAEVASLNPQKAARVSNATVEPSIDDEVPVESTWAYRLHLGRRLPQSAKGFDSTQVAKRPAAALVGQESALRFEMDPSKAEYGLSLIAFVDGAKSFTLHPHLDDKPLPDVVLQPGWGSYWATASQAAVSGSSHVLKFVHDAVPEKSTVAIDSVAVAPLEAEVTFGMGREAVGTLVDGFSKPSGESVWSEGPHSVMGIVLAPTAATPYRLHVRASALSRIAPLTVSARINGVAVGTAVFEKKGVDSTWNVPPTALHPGVNRVEFDYPQTAVPAEYNPNSKDTRSLALRFYRVGLAPAR